MENRPKYHNQKRYVQRQKELKVNPISCLFCSAVFYVSTGKETTAKYCSNKCKFLSQKGKKVSDITREKIRQTSIGRLKTPEQKKALSKLAKEKGFGKWMAGKKLTEKERLTRAIKFKKGELSHSWKGGLTSKNKILRCSLEYRLWRESVFKRDKFTCVFCSQKGGKLNADHIKPFAYYPELRFAIDNGRTLCKECHKKTDTYGSGALKYKHL